MNLEEMVMKRGKSVQAKQDEIRVKGKNIRVNSVAINGQTIIVTGKFARVASFMHEWDEDVEKPECLLEEIKNSHLKADILTFMQRLPEAEPKFSYYMEWDNVAAIPITSYDNWWKKQITQESRNKIRKANKKGVLIKLAEFDDEFVKGISSIYNETPIRQGKPFWHYGKDFETLKEIHSAFLERSDFIGTYFNGEMIGFIKLVNAGRFTRTMHVLSKVKHRDKAPTNLLLAKAVELCCERGIPYLVYGQFDYGKTGSKSLTTFKRENGFQKVLLPRYYVPLNLKGKMVLKLKLHHGIVSILPNKLIELLLDLRRKWYGGKFYRV